MLKKTILILFFSSFALSQCNNSIGDGNSDGHVDVSDVVYIINLVFDDVYDNILYIDLNQDSMLNIIDAVILVNRIVNPFLIESIISDVSYDFNSLNITWNRSLNYGFERYNLYYSNFFDNQDILLASSNSIDDTSIILNNINLKEQNFFWISFEDFLGCETIGPQYFYELPFKNYIIDDLGDVISSDFNVSDFSSALECIDCHEQYYNEWSTSMHAYSMNSPIFFSYKEKNKDIHPGTGENFCMQCHNPISYLTGTDLSMYSNVADFQNSTIDQVLKEGITCDICHTKTGLSETVHAQGNMSANAIYKMYPNNNIKFGSIQNPSPNDYHQSFYLPTYQSSQFCLPCHDLVINNIEAEPTFTEWNRIPGFSMFGGVSCQNCHMPEKDDGTHDHRFVGVDLDLTLPINDNPSYMDVQSLLSTSANINFNILGEELLNQVSSGDTLSIPLSIQSQTAHNFPSGTSFNREAWIEIQVTNNSNLLYESGVVENHEDLNYNDNDLLVFKSYLYDDDNNLTHNVTEVDSMVNYSLTPYQTRYKYYTIHIPDNIEGEVLVSARLLFRSFSPSFILDHHPEFINNLPIFEVDSISRIVNIE